MKKVAVIGAGITGLLASYYLCRKGHRVTVFEEQRYPAMKTSFANGGQLSVSNSETWTTYGNVTRGIRWMFKPDAPLLIRPNFDIDKIKWLFGFLKNTIMNTHYQNTIDSINLGLESRKLYKEIVSEENISFDQSDCGILHFYKDYEYFDKAKKSKSLYDDADAGTEWEIISAERVLDIEPTLKNAEGIVGGVWTPNDSVGDIHKFCNNLAIVLKEKYNVEFFFDTTINHIPSLNHYDAVVVSNGVGSTALAKTINENLGIYPVKGYSITIHAEDIRSYNALPKVSLLDDQAKIVTSTLGNRLRVAGTAELAGENYDIRRDRIEPLLDWVHNNLPNVDTRNYHSWACLRPMTPNMMPIVEQSKVNSKVFYHCGHGHLGWTYSPATAKQLADMI